MAGAKARRCGTINGGRGGVRYTRRPPRSLVKLVGRNSLPLECGGVRVARRAPRLFVKVFPAARFAKSSVTGSGIRQVVRRMASARFVRLGIREPVTLLLRHLRRKIRRGRVPINRGGMLESPVHGNPARPPFFGGNSFGANHAARRIEIREILPRENAPVAVEKRAPVKIRQLLQTFQVRRIVRVNWIVPDARGDERVIVRVVFARLHSRRGLLVDEKRFHPRVPDVSGIRRARHTRTRVAHRTAIAAGEKLPLAQREMRQLVNADEKEFARLILVNIIFALRIAEARGRAVVPGDRVLRFVERAIQLARHVAAKIEQQRAFQFRKSAAQQKRVRAGVFVRLQNRFYQQRFGFPRAGRSAKKPILRLAAMKFALLRKRLIAERDLQPLKLIGVGVVRSAWFLRAQRSLLLFKPALKRWNYDNRTGLLTHEGLMR